MTCVIWELFIYSKYLIFNILRDQGPLAFQRFKCIYPKIRHPHPHPQFQGSMVPYLIALASRNGSGTEWAGKVGRVIRVTGNEQMWVRSKATSFLACPFCTFKMPEGAGKRPEF